MNEYVIVQFSLKKSNNDTFPYILFSEIFVNHEKESNNNE